MYVISGRFLCGVLSMSVRVQFVLTDIEYKQLKDIVNKKGVSISKYIKDRVFPKDDDFETIWEEFTRKLARYPEGREFSVVDIMTEARWGTLDKSTKLSIGRLLNKKVNSDENSDEFKNIRLVRRSSSNVSLYIKGK